MFALSLVLKEASLNCPDPERAALERAEFLFKLRHKHQNFPLWLVAFSWERGDLSLAFPIIFFQTISCWFHHRKEMSAATPGLCEPLFKEQSCLLSHPAHPLCCLLLESGMSQGNPTDFLLGCCGSPTSSFCGMSKPGCAWFEFRSILVLKCPFRVIIYFCLPRTVDVCYQLLPVHQNKMFF